MANTDVRLSQSSTDMMHEILEDMRNYNFDSVNFAMLLYGVMNASEEKDGGSVLENYICSQDVYPMDIEDSLSLMITDYCAKLQDEYEKTHPKKKEVKNAKSSTSNSSKKKSGSKKDETKKGWNYFNSISNNHYCTNNFSRSNNKFNTTDKME